MDLDRSAQPAGCALCLRTLSPGNEASGDLDTISICGDCKFLFLEDIGSPSHRRRLRSRARRTRYSSSESVETLFSQQFSHMIDLVRHNQSTVSGHENQHATPRASRRWRRVLSDTESDGFDHLDSVNGETESNVSFGQHRAFHNDSDVISFSAYGGDSDASVDGHGFLDMEASVQPDYASNFDSDTDIDPMHAGLDQWNSDDPEEEEEGEWDEDDTTAVAHSQNAAISNSSENNSPANWRRHLHQFHLRAREGRETYAHDIFANLESELVPYIGNSGDYLDARGFEELLEQLAENDSSRRGAPPAALTFVNSLPLVAVNQEHLKHDCLACAICKDLLHIDSQVNQLPCFHLYHPSCILPWLSSRNTCPLCRYELPTDDKDYEEEKLNIGNRVRVRVIQQDNESEDSSSDVDEYNSQGRTEQRASSNAVSGRGRWFCVAAPIVSLVGIALVLWLGNPSSHRNSSQQIRGSSSVASQRENRIRRWWSLL